MIKIQALSFAFFQSQVLSGNGFASTSSLA
jgi:hypothetical protein